MSTITGKIYQQMNAAGTENRFPRTVVEAVLGLSSYLQGQFSSLSNLYVPQSRTVNGKALSSNIALTLDDISDGSVRGLANYLPLSGGTMSNTNLVSNLNADLLDGKHDGEVTAKNIAVKIGGSSTYYDMDTALAGGGLASTWFSFAKLIWGHTPSDMMYGNIWEIAGSEGVNTQLAFEVSNQNHGYGRVWHRSGDFANANPSNNWRQILTDDGAGRFGIGTSSPQYSLDVSGTFHASGNTEIGGSLIVDGDLTVPQYAGLNFEGASDVWLASLGLNSNADQLIVSFGADNDHVLLHDGNYTSYSPSLTQFNTSNGVLAEGIASNASRLDSLEDWLTDPRLTSLYSDSLSADSLNVPGNATLGAVTATSLACAALSGVSNINSKIYFSGANVGIANSSPSYGLDVAGTFRATGNAEFGGNVYLRSSVLIPKQITSYGEVEIGEVTENCFQIDDYGNALFEDVALRGMLLFHYYDTSEGDFVDGEVGYNGSNYYFDHAINAPAFNQTSDARLKTDLSPIALTVEQIASAPAVEFNWIGNGQRSAGSIAQYWENTLPYNVHHSGETLTMEYGNIALISAITCAREIQKLEARIKELEAKLNN